MIQPTKKLLESWKTNNFQNEDKFQAAAIKLIDDYFPELRMLRFHPMNEIYFPRLPDESDEDYKSRCSFYGSQNKAKGKLAGVPDICIKWRGVFFGLELKQPKGVLGDEQVKIHEAWNIDCEDVQIMVCRTLFEVYQYLVWVINSKFRVFKISQN